MIVIVVLNTEYMDVESRKIWYFKALKHCRANQWGIISHETLFLNKKNLHSKTDRRLLTEFEIGDLGDLDFDQVPQYYIPDEVFHKLEEKYKTRSAFLNAMYEKSEVDLEREFKKALRLFQKKEKVEAVLHILEPFQSLSKVLAEYSIPLIPFTFSAIRRVHGYTQTLYSAAIGDRLFGGADCEKRFHALTQEHSNLPILSRHIIIALFGKERTFPLLPLMTKDAPHELLICGDAYEVTPQIFKYAQLTDDDLYHSAAKHFGEVDIKWRHHALKLDRYGLDRTQLALDPAATILSCKRCTSVSSQILLKAMIWNRTVVMKSNTLPFSFACEVGFDSPQTVSLEFLNYYLFCYLIPNDLFFDSTYWLWRLSKPSEAEIYRRHLAFYTEIFALDSTLFDCGNEEYIFQKIMARRGFSQPELTRLMKDPGLKFSYECPVSRLRLLDENGCELTTIWVLNTRLDNGDFLSEFVVDREVGKPTSIKFTPFIDCSAFVNIKIICFSDYASSKEIAFPIDKGFQYMPKEHNEVVHDAPSTPAPFRIRILWQYRLHKDVMLNSGLIEM